MDAANVFELKSLDNLRRLHTDDLKDKTISFPHSLPVSKRSKYGDSEWHLKDLDNARHVTINESKTRIEWHLYALPPAIIDDLKRLAVLCLYATVCGKTNKAHKPNTVTTRIKGLARFLSVVFQDSILKKASGKTVSPIRNLSDIGYKQMRNTAAEYDQLGDEIKIALYNLGKPEVRQFLHSDPNSYDWNEHDVNNLAFKKNSKTKSERDWKDKTLPNSFFRFITKEAVKDVATALTVFGERLIDKPAESSIDTKIVEKFADGEEILNAYAEIRRLDIERSASLSARSDGSKVQNCTFVERKEFKEKFGVSTGEFHDWWITVRSSAQIVILQYIGFRQSESLSLKFDHALPKGKKLISKSGNIWVINGTVIKHKDNALPTDHDQWVAIPIVRDAIAVLEKLNVITDKSYVFSSSQNRGKSEDRGKTYNRDTLDTPYSAGGFNIALNSWLKKKDVDSEWAHWNLNAKQFRHSIANQLARAELGLEFITYQMKHMVHALNEMPSDVTLGYGGVGDMAQQNALNAARYEAVRNLYHPDNPLAGGMADEFRISRNAHFKGAMADGFSEDEYFSILAGQGIPFINVGGGYCSGRKYVQYSDGSKSNAACIGHFECSPAKCANSLVTKAHVPVWIDMYKSNLKNADDPELFYARESFLERANDAKKVLEELDVDTETLL